MARGWESKSVEDQIVQAQATRYAREKQALTAEQIEQLRQRDALLLERTRLVKEMERAYKRRHLESLERGLAHIERELAKLEGKNSS
jgi:hypothetical protein